MIPQFLLLSTLFFANIDASRCSLEEHSKRLRIYVKLDRFELSEFKYNQANFIRPRPVV